MNVFW